LKGRAYSRGGAGLAAGGLGSIVGVALASITARVIESSETFVPATL
jgi:hypothetical protein